MSSPSNAAFPPAPRRASSIPFVLRAIARVRPCLGVLPLAGAAAAFAQSADTVSQQVVVTAARAPQALPDTLPATTVITREDIQQAPVSDLPSLLRTATSLDIAQQGPLGSQTSVFVRGANSNQVLVLVDGAPLSRADFGSAPWELIPLEQVDHIEIVRGNLSSLYGAQAVGGVVQIFTKKGPGASVSLGAGSRGTVIASGTAGTRIGDAATPLDLSATLSAQTTDGYNARDPKRDPSASYNPDPAYQGGATVRVAKTWVPGQRTDFTFLHTYTHSDYDGYTTVPERDTLTTELDSFNLQSHHELTAVLRLDLTATQTVEHFSDPTEVDSTFGPQATYGSGRTSVLGAQLEWQAAPEHTVQLGGEDRVERFGTELDPQHFRRTHSVRAGYIGNFANTLEVQANARHDDADDYGSANTGLLALGWKLSRAWKLVGQVSTAFSAPSFSDQQFAAPGSELQAERSRDLEFGAHWTGQDWLARATWFSQRQHNLIGYNAQFESVNIGHASNRGVELAADGQAGPGKLGLDATFQNPRDDDADARLARRARTNVAVNYRMPLAGWETGVWVRYAGSRADVDPVTFAAVNAPSRTTVGLSTQHAIAPGWTLGLKLDNAANSRVPETLGYTPPPRQFLVTMRGQWM